MAQPPNYFDTSKSRPYDARPMSIQARTLAVSPHELARKGGLFCSEIPLSAFPRLAALVLGNGVVDVRLEFSQDDQGRTHVRGSAVAEVALECQRCLEPVVRRLDANIDLRVVASDTIAQQFADEFESFVSTDDEVPVIDLIEDDLILALPS